MSPGPQKRKFNKFIFFPPYLCCLFLIHCYIHFRYKPSPEDVLLKAFLVLDQDGKGYLTQDELAKYMTEDGKYILILWKLRFLQLF